MNANLNHLNINNLYPIFNNEDIAFQFSVQNNLIFQSLVCEECNNETNIQRDSYRKFGFFFKCPQCYKQYSILYHSVFYYSKLPISKYYLLYIAGLISILLKELAVLLLFLIEPKKHYGMGF